MPNLTRFPSVQESMSDAADKLKNGESRIEHSLGKFAFCEAKVNPMRTFTIYEFYIIFETTIACLDRMRSVRHEQQGGEKPMKVNQLIIDSRRFV